MFARITSCKSNLEDVTILDKNAPENVKINSSHGTKILILHVLTKTQGVFLSKKVYFLLLFFVF